MTINRNGILSPPRIIPVGEEPPPMDSGPAPSSNGRQQRHQGRERGKAKGISAKRKSAQRFAVLNDFVDFTLAGLSRADIAVWLTLYRDTRDGTAQTAYDDLARRTGLNRRNVGRALRRLELRDLVQVVRRGALNRGPSRYRVRPLARDA